MIEDPPVLTLRRKFNRPTAEKIAKFENIQTGFIVDAMNGRGALNGKIKPLINTQANFTGTAVTCHAGPGDNLAVFGAMELTLPGDVVIASTEQFHRSEIIGDLVLGMMKNKKIAGFVTDGFVRDIAGIEEVGLPCFAMGVTPNSPVRNGPGTAGQSICLGDVTVSSGDIIVGDIDGVVIIPFHKIDTTIHNLNQIITLESDLNASVQTGLERPAFIQDFFDSGQIQEVD